MSVKAEMKSPLSRQEIAKNLSPKISSLVKIEYCDVCDSTNRLAKDSPFDGGVCVYVANEQTNGRGRLGRSFYSAPNAGLYMSFLYRPSTEAKDALAITRYAAVKLCRAIESQVELNCQIKWVNDIYLKGKKAAGILAEGVFDPDSGRVERVVLGIGINVCHLDFPPELSDIATTIEDASGVSLDRSRLAARVIEEICSSLENMTGADIAREYRERSILIGKDVLVKRGEDTYPATVIDISDSGELVLRLSGGEVERLYTGEVSIRIKK